MSRWLYFAHLSFKAPLSLYGVHIRLIMNTFLGGKFSDIYDNSGPQVALWANVVTLRGIHWGVNDQSSHLYHAPRLATHSVCHTLSLTLLSDNTHTRPQPCSAYLSVEYTTQAQVKYLLHIYSRGRKYRSQPTMTHWHMQRTTSLKTFQKEGNFSSISFLREKLSCLCSIEIFFRSSFRGFESPCNAELKRIFFSWLIEYRQQSLPVWGRRLNRQTPDNEGSHHPVSLGHHIHRHCSGAGGRIFLHRPLAGFDRGPERDSDHCYQ